MSGSEGRQGTLRLRRANAATRAFVFGRSTEIATDPSHVRMGYRKPE